jgi:hypothetical protein
MMRVVACLAAALSLPSFAMPVKFTATDCGASSGHYQSSDVVPAQPHTGQVFKVTNHFTFDEDVTGGQFDVKVTALGGIPLKRQTGPLCGFDTSYDVHLAVVKVASVTVYGSQCPIAKGPADIKYDVKISSILPPVLGNSAFHLTAKNQKGTDIACVQAKLGIALEDGVDTATESSAGSNVAIAEMDKQVAQVAQGLNLPTIVPPGKCIPDMRSCLVLVGGAYHNVCKECCACIKQHTGACTHTYDDPDHTPHRFCGPPHMEDDHSEIANGSPASLVV